MTTPGSQRSTSSASTANRKDKENEILCLVCYQTWAVDMVQHVINCKVANEIYPKRSDRRKLGIKNAKLYRRACAKMGRSLFFSMAELNKKERYSPYEVAELLQSLGHCLVPEEFEEVYVRRPVYNNLTDRNFGKELEDDNKSQRMEAVMAKELQKRRAANVKH